MMETIASLIVIAFWLFGTLFLSLLAWIAGTKMFVRWALLFGLGALLGYWFQPAPRVHFAPLRVELRPLPTPAPPPHVDTHAPFVPEQPKPYSITLPV